MRRVVSLYLPGWSTDRLRRKSGASRAEGLAPNRPLATVLPDHGRKVVAAADAGARSLGVHPGMTLTKARSLVPELVAEDADPTSDLAALRRLALWCGRYSPFVAPDPPDGVWIDITGCAPLFGSERALLRDLHRRIARAGYAVQIAVADTPGCAHAVARYVPAGRPVTIEPGAQRQAIALLPIASLRLEATVVEGLRKLGFERVEQLIATPRGPLARRFGRTLHQRLDQALGYAPEAIEPIFAREVPRCRRSLLEPIATAEAFAQVIGDLVGDLAGQLVRLGRGARRLDLHFHRVDGCSQAIRIGTAAPSRDVAHLAKLLVARVGQIDPGLGIEAMTLVAPLTEPLGPAQSALAEDGKRSADLGALVDALANRFGSGKLYRAAPCAGGMPERSVAQLPALGVATGRRFADDLPRPGRLIDPPQPVQVMAMLPDHPPAMFVWKRKRYRVVQADGPERLHGEWWREAGHEARQPWSVRDYFQVEVEGGGRYWLFRLGDGERAATGPMQWFIHGAFA
ncbi:MAG: DNA polymerase Y family protein [Sphingomonas sp.]|uniref:Y-family DNA polymerase n=1 Tax=Sphingomonas sp. TaxID=28214 RepID=UPI001B0A2A2B|nr:DNA polymerase Y family protein [Sphingomonas sp.]MBO9623938.1 DNA polymerase Y family protein [Sphingomonas sp.]